MIATVTNDQSAHQQIGVRPVTLEGQALFLAHITIGHDPALGEAYYVVIEAIGMSEIEAIKSVIRKATVLADYLEQVKRDFAPKLLRQRAEDERELLAHLKTLGLDSPADNKKPPQN